MRFLGVPSLANWAGKGLSLMLPSGQEQVLHCKQGSDLVGHRWGRMQKKWMTQELEQLDDKRL